jgi:hypothetical protein
LYFLLAHSDNTAQRTLEQIVDLEGFGTRLVELGCTATRYVSIAASDASNRSVTSPADVTALFAGIWNGELLSGEQRELFLKYLSQSRMTYVGLRTLPCSLNTATPTINTYYSKAGKVRDCVADSLILETNNGVLAMSCHVQGLETTEFGNSVDHPAIRLVGELAELVYNTWQEHSTADSEKI